MIIICNLMSHLKQKRNISNSYFRFKLACLSNLIDVWMLLKWSNFEILFHCFVFAFVLFNNYWGGGGAFCIVSILKALNFVQAIIVHVQLFIPFIYKVLFSVSALHTIVNDTSVYCCWSFITSHTIKRSYT